MQDVCRYTYACNLLNYMFCWSCRCICFQDLRSTNVMEVCCALTVVCKLINKDMMPALLPQVLELVQSKRLAWFLFSIYLFFFSTWWYMYMHFCTNEEINYQIDLKTHAWVFSCFISYFSLCPIRLSLNWELCYVFVKKGMSDSTIFSCHSFFFSCVCL